MAPVDRLSVALGNAAGWAFPIIAVMMGYEVVARYAFNAPTFWAHEIAGLIAAVAFVLGGPAVMAEKTHMRVTLLIDRFGKARWWAELLALSCGLVFLLGLTVSMVGIVERSAWRFSSDGVWTPERSGSSWNTASPTLLKIALLFGAALFLAVVLRQAISLLRGGPIDDSQGDDHKDDTRSEPSER